MTAVIRRHPLATFVLIVASASVLALAIVGPPQLLATPAGSPGLALAVFPLMVLSVALAGIGLTAVVDGRSGVRELAGRIVKWRFAWRWWLVPLVPPIAVIGVLAILSMTVSTAFAPGFFPVGLAFGLVAGFFEEIGWSGFAYRQLRTRRAPMVAALLLGFGWGIWHLPVVDALGAASPHGSSWPAFFAAFVVVLMGLRLVISAAYEATGSMLLAQIVHASSTASLVVFGANAVTPGQEAAWYALYAVVLWVVGVALMRRRAGVQARDRPRSDRTRDPAGDDAERAEGHEREAAPARRNPGSLALTDRAPIPIILLGISPVPGTAGPAPASPETEAASAATGASMTSTRDLVRDERDKFAFHDDIVYLAETKRGLTRETVEEISRFKNEPEWMLQFRLRAYDHFVKRPMPSWSDGLDEIDFDKIVYYRKPSEREEKSWDDVPDQIKATFEKLGIPEAERKFLAGVGAQYDSEVVYHSVREELQKIGVVFMGTDQALKEYPEIFRQHFGTVVPPEDNKFAALNSAVWSGGSFVYVPKGVEVPLPLQAYFRINGENTGQFERTLIVVDEGAKVHYIEGCTAPIYATDSLHAAVVEVIALPGSKVRYTTIQNWSNDVYNLVTKRAHAHERSTVEWVDANTGSKKTVKFPAIYLRGEGARAEVISVAVAGKGQHQDTGAKAVHLAPNTTSRIVSKSVSKDGGRATYRGQLRVAPGATGVTASVRCDALMLDDQSRSDTYPYIDIQEDDTTMTHEATVGKISQDQIFYLMSRGLTENEAQNLVIQGFLEVFTKELPMEYAIEFNRLVKLEMEGSLG
jgi:Fe-S cluster assembly protein SufB